MQDKKTRRIELFAFDSEPQWWWEWSRIKERWGRRDPEKKDPEIGEKKPLQYSM